MFKIIILLTLFLSLGACSNNNEEVVNNPIITNDSNIIIDDIYDDNNIKKVLNDQEIAALINDDIKEYSLNNLGYFEVESIKNINKDFSDVTFINYDDEIINLNDFKGQKVVLDFITNTCPNCQSFTKDEYHKIKKNNPDIIFIQVFLNGNKNDIASFYQEINQDFDPKFTIPQNDDNITLFNSLNIGYVPCFVFLNDDSIVTYTNVGDVNNDNFIHHLELSYGDKAFYKMIDQTLLKDIQRNYLDIKNDIDPSIIKQIDELNVFNIDQEVYDKIIYSDIAKKITPYIIESYDGKILNKDDFLNHKVLLNFYIANEEYDDKNKMIAQSLKEVANIHPEYIIINIALEHDNIPIDIYLDTTDTEFVGYTIYLKDDSISNEFKKLSLYTLPSLYFIDEGGFIAGVLAQSYDINLYQKAEAIYFSDNPIYKINPSH